MTTTTQPVFTFTVASAEERMKGVSYTYIIHAATYEEADDYALALWFEDKPSGEYTAPIKVAS